MNHELTRLTRRQLLYALGLGSGFAALPHPVTLLGQGQCGGARAGTPGCDTTPAKAPFDATGWKTVRLNHFSIQAADYGKEAAYYVALMNWKPRSDDGKQAVLDIGDWGGAIIRGGYEAPPPPPTPATAPADAAGGGGQRAGGGAGGRGGARAPRLVQVESFSWGITPWDSKKVAADLKSRGIDATAVDDKNLSGFRFTDPGGFTCEITDGRINPRAKAPNGKLSAPPPFEPTDWKTVWLDHVSFEVPNYKESVAFYQALLGWTPTQDEGSQNFTDAGDVGGLIIRRGAGGGTGRRGADASTVTPAVILPPRPAGIGHIAFGIAPWDPDKVKEALEKRGLTARVDTGGKGDIHGASYQSYHTTTPNGFDLQISFATKETRHAGIG